MMKEIGHSIWRWIQFQFSANSTRMDLHYKDWIQCEKKSKHKLNQPNNPNSPEMHWSCLPLKQLKSQPIDWLDLRTCACGCADVGDVGADYEYEILIFDDFKTSAALISFAHFACKWLCLFAWLFVRFENSIAI